MSAEKNETFQEIVRGVELDDSLIRIYETVEDEAFRHAVEEAIDAPLIHGAAQRYATEYDRLMALAEIKDYDINLKLVMHEMMNKHGLSDAQITEALFICKAQIHQLKAIVRKSRHTQDYPEA